MSYTARNNERDLVWRVWYAPEKIARHGMEIDYGNNKESYDKRDGEGD